MSGSLEDVVHPFTLGQDASCGIEKLQSLLEIFRTKCFITESKEEDESEDKLPPEQFIGVFKISQTALGNVIKFSNLQN